MNAHANTLGTTADETLDCGPLGQIRVPGEWIDFITGYNDVFRSDHAGYWMYGAERLDSGWLVYESGDHGRPSERAVKRALRAHKAGEGVPNRFFVIDKAFAVKAYVEGVKRWGADWYDDYDHDASSYDVIIQMAALGEVRYG